MIEYYNVEIFKYYNVEIFKFYNAEKMHTIPQMGVTIHQLFFLKKITKNKHHPPNGGNNKNFKTKKNKWG